jgi:CheY-like chemotaxis protein
MINSTETELRQEKILPPKKRILVIDDSLDNLLLAKTILDSKNYEVLTSQNVEEAFTTLDEESRPDLILLDMCLDDMSGPEFLVELEKTRPKIVKTVPIVFLSAMDKAPESVAVGFIRKPIDVSKFLAEVKSFIEEGTLRSLCKH